MFNFPRGKVRIELGKQGLIGKVCLQSWMSEDDIRAEIYSCFKKPFFEDPQFPFKYLQSAGAGAKSLIVPAVGDNFQWSAKQVAQMGGSRAVYIWAQKALMVKESESEQEVVRMNGFCHYIKPLSFHLSFVTRVMKRGMTGYMRTMVNFLLRESLTQILVHRIGLSFCHRVVMISYCIVYCVNM